jgi:hypothetical protein
MRSVYYFWDNPRINIILSELYGYETWFLTLTEERELQMSENEFLE